MQSQWVGLACTTRNWVVKLIVRLLCLGINEVSDEEMGGVLTTGDCRQAVARLLELALRRGGRDNISVVVAQAEDIFCLDKTQINPTL